MALIPALQLCADQLNPECSVGLINDRKALDPRARLQSRLSSSDINKWIGGVIAPVVSRDELYELVWSKPTTKVAVQFAVSGSYLARVCTALNVPRPPRGYWAKLEVGKAPLREPLPEARPGDQLDWSKDGELQPRPIRPPLRLTPPQPQTTRVRIPKDHVHALIRGAKSLFEHSRPVDDDAYLKPYKKRLVNILASKACLEKALDFANELFNAFEAAGHRVALGAGQLLRRAEIDERELPSKKHNRYYEYQSRRLWSPDRATVVYIGTLAIGLSIVETSENVLLRYIGGSKYVRDADYVPPRRSRYHVDRTWTTTRDLPCGRLRLTAYAPHWRVDWAMSWQETKQRSLRTTVKSIVKTIEGSAADLISKLEEADRQAEIERQRALEAEERRRREEDQRRIEESIRESREHLGRIIQQWSSVMSVEQFLVGVDQRAAALPEAERDQVQDRLRLAHDFLGNQDPLDFFLSWKTPRERYRPRYTEE